MKGRVLVAGVGLWLVVVALGSGLTWMVVQHVAHLVSSDGSADGSPSLSAPGPLPTVATPDGATASTPAGRRTPRTTAHRSHRPQRSPVGTPVVRPTPAATAVPAPTRPVPTPRATRRPGGSGSGGPAGSSGGSDDAVGSGSGAGTGSATTTRTWSGTGGRVTVSCRSDRASLVSASPADGWQVEVGSRGGEEVEVTFRQPGTEVQVQGRCQSGAPRFSVERGGD